MGRLLAAVLAVLVAGCAFPTKVLSSSPRTVVVQALKVSDAQAMADAECKKHGRLARWASGDSVEFFFDCVL